MKRLVVIGAGGFGREMVAAARESEGFGTLFEIAGFLDDDASALDGFAGYPPVLGGVEEYRPREDDVFITALGDIAARRRCAEAIGSKGGKFATVVHKTAVVGPNVEIGPGSFLAPGVCITADVRIGSHACIFHNSSVGHDSYIGDFAHVYAQCSIGGGVKVLAGARIYPGSVVTPRRTVGEDAVVGALSAVFADVPPGGRVLGNPAMPLI